MFVRNLEAFTLALGVQNAPSVIALSQVPWPNDDLRNEFIQKLTGVSIKARLSYGS